MHLIFFWLILPSSIRTASTLQGASASTQMVFSKTVCYFIIIIDYHALLFASLSFILLLSNPLSIVMWSNYNIGIYDDDLLVYSSHTWPIHLLASCYGTIVSGQPCNLYVMESAPQPSYTPFPYVWPLPQQFTNGSTNVTVNSVGFVFSSNVTSADLTAAFQRFQPLIFPHPSIPSGPNSIGGVTVNVWRSIGM